MSLALAKLRRTSLKSLSSQSEGVVSRLGESHQPPVSPRGPSVSSGVGKRSDVPDLAAAAAVVVVSSCILVANSMQT